jgi:IS1 family transposase
VKAYIPTKEKFKLWCFSSVVMTRSEIEISIGEYSMFYDKDDLFAREYLKRWMKVNGWTPRIEGDNLWIRHRGDQPVRVVYARLQSRSVLKLSKGCFTGRSYSCIPPCVVVYSSIRSQRQEGFWYVVSPSPAVEVHGKLKQLGVQLDWFLAVEVANGKGVVRVSDSPIIRSFAHGNVALGSKADDLSKLEIMASDHGVSRWHVATAVEFLAELNRRYTGFKNGNKASVRQE